MALMRQILSRCRNCDAQIFSTLGAYVRINCSRLIRYHGSFTFHDDYANCNEAIICGSRGGRSYRFPSTGAISFAHFLNDMIQSLIVAIYPLLKGNFNLNFAQIGLITLTYQITASILQPVVGLYTDKNPRPYSLALGMGFTLVGLLLLSVAPNYGLVLLAAALVGTGSSIFHPESSRVARMASGGRHGLAQSIFRWVEMQVVLWGLCWLPGSSSLKVRVALRGSLSQPCWR